MASSVVLESTAIVNGNLVLNAVMVTDFAKIPHQFIFSPSTSVKQIRAAVKAHLDGIILSDTVSKALPTGTMDLTLIADDPVPDDVKARRQFAADVSTFRQYQRAVTFGLVAGDDKAMADLLTSIKDRFVPEYLDLI